MLWKQHFCVVIPDSRVSGILHKVSVFLDMLTQMNLLHKVHIRHLASKVKGIMSRKTVWPFKQMLVITSRKILWQKALGPA